MLPTHGVASGVFLLVNAARHQTHENLEALVAQARRSSSFMAGALDLRRCADGLAQVGLVEESAAVKFDPRLAVLSESADRVTLARISAILLARTPPPWLLLAVENGEVSREYIPLDDQRDLEWLEPWLDKILITVASSLEFRQLQPMKEALGRAGELVVLAAAQAVGHAPTHVADISDGFGYDIEIQGPTNLRIEVKSTTWSRRGTFHLSRNEFDKCRAYGPGWIVAQVVFDSGVLSAPEILAAHVLEIKKLAGSVVQELVPPDSATFRWAESAVLTAAPSRWEAFDFGVPSTLRLPSMRALARLPLSPDPPTLIR